MNRVGLAIALLTGTGGVGACGFTTDDRATERGSWRAEVDTLGDTIVVRTVAGSEWQRVELVEELRIGRVEGDRHEMFGRVSALAVTPAGDILVYDAQFEELRRYGADGAYLGTIGAAGSGPGEYRNVAGIAVMSDGRIVVSDFGNRRFNVYSAAGEPVDTWLVRASIAEARPLHAHPDGGVFLHDLQRGSRDAAAEVLIHLDADGNAQDTLLIPHADHQRPGLELSNERVSVGTYVPFTASSAWSVTSRGELASTTGSRYAVGLQRANGTVLRIERDAAAVPVSAEERAAEEARVIEFFRRLEPGWRWDGPQIPDSRPPIGGLHTGIDGTIWVRVAQPGTVIAEAERAPRARTFVHEPIVFDVFESDGRYLGDVSAPDRFLLMPHPVLSRERVWGVIHDDNDVSFIVRYRVAGG